MVMAFFWQKHTSLFAYSSHLLCPLCPFSPPYLSISFLPDAMRHPLNKCYLVPSTQLCRDKSDRHMTRNLAIIFLSHTHTLTRAIIISLLMSGVLSMTYEPFGWTAEMICSLYGVFVLCYFLLWFAFCISCSVTEKWMCSPLRSWQHGDCISLLSKCPPR